MSQFTFLLKAEMFITIEVTTFELQHFLCNVTVVQLLIKMNLCTLLHNKMCL